MSNPAKLDVNAVLKPLDDALALIAPCSLAEQDILVAARLLRNELGGLIELTGFTRVALPAVRTEAANHDACHAYFVAIQMLADRLKLEPYWSVAALMPSKRYWLMPSIEGTAQWLWLASTGRNGSIDFENMAFFKDEEQVRSWGLGEEEYREFAVSILQWLDHPVFRPMTMTELCEAQRVLEHLRNAPAA